MPSLSARGLGLCGGFVFAAGHAGDDLRAAVGGGEAAEEEAQAHDGVQFFPRRPGAPRADRLLETRVPRPRRVLGAGWR